MTIDVPIEISEGSDWAWMETRGWNRSACVFFLEQHTNIGGRGATYNLDGKTTPKALENLETNPHPRGRCRREERKQAITNSK